jgi:hypothetical protein
MTPQMAARALLVGEVVADSRSTCSGMPKATGADKQVIPPHIHNCSMQGL